MFFVPGHGVGRVSMGRLSGWAPSGGSGGLTLWLWSSLDICSGARCQVTRNYPAKETHRKKTRLMLENTQLSLFPLSLFPPIVFGSCQWAKALKKTTSSLGNNAWQKKKLKWHNEAEHGQKLSIYGVVWYNRLNKEINIILMLRPWHSCGEHAISRVSLIKMSN